MKKTAFTFAVLAVFAFMFFAGCTATSPAEPDLPADTVKERFFYVSDEGTGSRDIACMNYDGTGNTIAAYGTGVIYLAGKVTDSGKVYYTRGGENKLYEMDAVTFAAAEKPGFTSGYQEVSTCKSGMTAVFNLSSEIFKTSLSASSDINLTVTGSQYEYMPVISANGGKILYLENNNIKTMNADGTGIVSLGPDITDGFVYSADWSPDGSKIAYILHNTDSSVYQIRVMNADGTGDGMIYENSAESFVLRWLWRSNVIVFDRYLPADTTTDIYSISPDGTGLNKLTDMPAGGTALLYVSIT